MTTTFGTKIAARTVIIYLIAGVLWILLSDHIVNSLPFPHRVIEELQTLKGLAYVLLSAILIYFIIQRSVSRQEKIMSLARESEEKFQSIVSSVMDAVISFDAEKEVILFNASAERMFGYRAEEVAGKPIDILLPDRFRDIPDAFIQSDISTQKIGVLNITTGIRSTGEEFPVEASISYTIFKGKKISTVILRDTTERVKFERSLHEMEERFRLLVEGVKDYAIYLLDPDGCIVTWNGGARTIKGYEIEEVIGKHFSMFYTHEEQLRDRPAELLRLAAENGFVEEEGIRVRKNGELFSAHVMITAMYDSHGAVKGFSKVTRDITEQKKYQQKIIDEKNFSDSLLNALPGVLYYYDRTGKFLRWNRNFEIVSGYSGEEIATMHPLDFFSGKEKLYLQERIAEVFEKGESEAEAKFRTKDGTLIPYYFTGRKVEINGEICLIGMGIDISERVKMEQVLRESEERYRNLVDHSPMMIGVFSEGKFLYMNEAGCSVFGASSFDQIKERPTIDFVHPEFMPLIEERYKNVLRGKANPRITVRLTGVDKKVRTVETTSIPLIWEGKNRMLVIGQDVTEQQKAFGEAEEYRRKLVNTLESMTDAFVSLDRNWCYTFMNRAAGVIFARDPKLIIGKHIWTEFPEGKGQPFHAAYERAMNEREFLWLEEYYPPYDRWFENRIYPTDDGISIFFHDITPRKKAEAKLKESEERFRTTLENLQEGCQIVDFDFRYVYLNPVAQQHNRNNRTEMIGRTMMEIFPGIEELEFFKEIQRCNRERRSHRMNIEFQFADGYKGWFDVNIEPIPEGIFILSSEITEKVKVEEKISRYHEQLHALTNNLQISIENERARISRELHDDLGQTISALRMDILMFKKLLTQSTDPQMNQLAESEIPSMTKMIDGVVLAMRKIIRDLRPEVLDTLGIIGGLRWQAEEFQRRTQINCSLNVPAHDIELDPQRSTALFRVLQESLTNVVRHAEATAVDISLSMKSEFLTLVVKDNGKGITEEEQLKVSSFGLLGMRERLRAINGTLTIEGVSGKGTTLTVTIPT